jgi:hypothetical protein
MALLLCLPGSVFAGSGPNSGTGPDNILLSYKPKGPSPNAFILAGWRPPADYPESILGILEVFVWVGGQFYSGVYDNEHSEGAMLAATESDIILLDDDISYWTLPEEIATELYGKPAGTRVVVFEAKDVSDFNVDTYPIDNFYDWTIGGEAELGYRHMLYGNVKLTFLVPINK